MEKVFVRQYKPKDLKLVLAITLLAWKPIYASFKKYMGTKNFNAFYPNWRTYKVDQMKNFLKAKNFNALVAEKNGVVVGFALYEINIKKKTAEIHNNAVNPKYQGQGIGPLMYQSVFKDMKTKGVKSVVVRTGGEESHARARRAYEKAGFTHALPTVKLYRTL